MLRQERSLRMRQREGRGYRHRLKNRTPLRMFAPGPGLDGAHIDVELLRCLGRSLRLSFEAPDGVTIVREELLGRAAGREAAAASAPSARSIEFRPAGPPRQAGQRRLMLTLAIGEAVLLLGGGSSTGVPAWQIRLVADRAGVVSGHVRIKAPESVRFEHGRLPEAAG